MYASFALRLLVEGPHAEQSPDHVAWDELLRIARRNVVLIRLAARLEEAGLRPPPFFVEAVKREQQRSRAIFDLICRISRACDALGIQFVFAKAFQHYPDMGGDVDLFLVSRSTEVDELILQRMLVGLPKRGLSRWMAGVSYRISECDTVLDIHHGRMGLVGEHGSHISHLIRNGERVPFEGHEFLIPSAEDSLVLQGMQRVYRHSFIRLCDIVYTIRLLRRSALDWDYVLRTTDKLGARYGLRCYLSYLEQIHCAVLGDALLPKELRRELALDGCGRVEFREGVYRFSRSKVAGRVYLDKMRAAVRAGNWDDAGRLSLIPLVATARAFRKLSERAPAPPGF